MMMSGYDVPSFIGPPDDNKPLLSSIQGMYLREREKRTRTRTHTRTQRAVNYSIFDRQNALSLTYVLASLAARLVCLDVVCVCVAVAAMCFVPSFTRPLFSICLKGFPCLLHSLLTHACSRVLCLAYTQEKKGKK